jgi:hypothetical protein
MLMRYWWGLGIGHTYSHTGSSEDHTNAASTDGGLDLEFREDVECEGELGQRKGDHQAEDGDGQANPVTADDDPELDMDERENEDLGERFGMEQVSAECGEGEDELDDETFLAMEDMYGLQV